MFKETYESMFGEKGRFSADEGMDDELKKSCDQMFELFKLINVKKDKELNGGI